MESLTKNEGFNKTMFLMASPIGIVSLLILIKHCYDVRDISQKTFLISKVGLLIGIMMSIPYNWDKRLMRIKMMVNATLYLIVVMLLSYGVMYGSPATEDKKKGDK